MSCVLALALATTSAWSGQAPLVLARREAIILARDPLPHESDRGANGIGEVRTGLKAIVVLPGGITHYVRLTPLQILKTAPCLPDDTTETTLREGNGRRPTP